MATANPVPGLQGPLGVAKKITGWYIGAAVLFIVLGIFAIIEPGVASLGVTLLVGWLLIGSIPGGLLGSQLSTRVPMLWLRRILCTILLVTGARMLWIS